MTVLSVIFVLLALSSLSIGLDLFCQFDFKSKIKDDDQMDYTCNSIGLETRFPNVKISTVFGSHLAGHSNADVRIVEILRQKISYPPIELASFFPNIETFKIHRSHLQSISRNNFEGMPHLKELSFFSNNISAIPADTFNDLLNLEDLSLSQNNIVKIEENLFRMVVNLREIFMRNNKIETITAKLFETNVKLDTIWLQNNHLITVATEAFSHLKNLKSLSLNNNPCITKDYPSKEIKTLDDLENILKTECSKTCEDLTSDLSKYVREYSQCEEEFERISRENVKMRNQEKVCLIL